MGLESISSKKPTLVCGATSYDFAIDPLLKPSSYSQLQKSLENYKSIHSHISDSADSVNRFQYCELQIGQPYKYVKVNGLFDASLDLSLL